MLFFKISLLNVSYSFLRCVKELLLLFCEKAVIVTPSKTLVLISCLSDQLEDISDV